MQQLLAHSARPAGGVPEQPYIEHVRAVRRLAHEYAVAVCRFSTYCTARFLEIVDLAAVWHDLGKMDSENQRVLASARRDPLPVQHEHAGVQYLLERRHGMAAALVCAHHRGLPSILKEASEDAPFDCFNQKTIDRTHRFLSEYVRQHIAALTDGGECGSAHQNWRIEAARCSGLAWRMALSCLVDADHTDTARHYGNETEAQLVAPRWKERRQSLERYIQRFAGLPDSKSERNRLRRCVYEGCRDLVPVQRRYACDSGVGTGKTTAVMAHLLRVAEERQLRHILVVLPYMNIINQSVDTYRKALVLTGEDPDRVVAAHHHQVDFESAELRQLATLWDYPITVTTAVQFFETLAASRPGRLRKLHELAGSAVFIDEAHAALPAWLWPQTWLWIDELTRDWGCHFVFASGSLVRFWEHEDFVKPPASIPVLLSAQIREETESAERSRVKYVREKQALTTASLSDLVIRTTDENGPCLVIVNTVRTAAEVARHMKSMGCDVLHLSTALAPMDRDPIIRKVEKRLKDPNDRAWTLVATSCVEAGIDFDFRSAFREAASTSSMLQVGGRVNRHGGQRSTVLVFKLADIHATQNPAMKVPAQVLDRLFERGDVQRLSASELCTAALQGELNEEAVKNLKEIEELEKKKDYPGVSERYRVIPDETVTVLVEPTLSRFESGERLRSVDIVRGSVQIRRAAAKRMALRPLRGNDELFGWTLDYEPELLGYMKGVLDTAAAMAGEFLGA